LPGRARFFERIFALATTPILLLPGFVPYPATETAIRHLVLTNRLLAFLGTGRISREPGPTNAIPFEHITSVSVNEEILIVSEHLGWRWHLGSSTWTNSNESTSTFAEGLVGIAAMIRESVARRRTEIGRRANGRKRIQSFRVSRERRRE
jgi:hypothetical protein